MNIKYIILLLLLFNFYNCQSQNKQAEETNQTAINLPMDSLLFELRGRAKQALAYSEKNKLNTDYCILADLRIHSGRNRFFVWDHKTDSIHFATLTCHGKGGTSTNELPEFSNVPNTNCSSLGFYRVGVRAPSQYGIKIHYKLHGLEATNSNAFKRYIVLHSYETIPQQESYPEYIRLSSGCPALPDDAMTYMDTFIQAQKTPLLLWIYY